MTAPILFLDFDGVLHPASAYQTQAFCHAPALAACLEPYACEIVISSSWRFSYSLDELRSFLPQGLAIRVTGATGSAHIGRHARYLEIRQYLQTRILPGNAWGALDDATWEFPSGFRNLFACNPNTGLAERQLKDLQKWLGRSVILPG